MCGRYVLDATPAMLASTFAAVDRLGVFEPRFNAAPGQDLPIVVSSGEGNVLESARWGLVRTRPDGRRGMQINARIEGLGRHFGASSTHCLVPATGFYEWAPGEPVEEIDDQGSLFSDGPVHTKPGPKQPWCFHLPGGALFAFLGVLQDVADEHGEARRHFAIVTRPPTVFVEPIHDRMPAIARNGTGARWLGVDGAVPELLEETAPDLEAVRVSRDVNDVANDGPQLVAPPA